MLTSRIPLYTSRLLSQSMIAKPSTTFSKRIGSESFAYSFNRKSSSAASETATASNVKSVINRFKPAESIEKHYQTSHAPLGHPRKYGPPYTDVSLLEVLPQNTYENHFAPVTFGDKVALSLVKFFQIFTNLFFRDKYTHHAVVLESVAAVPGMVAGMGRHLKSLRRMERDHGWIGKLLEEAENERMHLLTWMQVVKPTFLERLLVIAAQCFYFPAYAALYILSPKVAHRFVGYLEEVACREYTHFLNAIDDGKIINVDAPEIAKNYWNLPPDAKLRDVVLAVRADEAMHRDVNHVFSEKARYGLN